MAIKIGNLDISAFKVGSDDCKVYLGDTKLYPIWTFIESNTQNVPNAVAIRIPSDTVLQGDHNIAFGDTQVNVYSLLYENGVWYNWRVITDGQWTPYSKTPLTSVDGYYVIEFDDSYPFLGSDGDSSGQGGVNYTTFDIEIKEGGTTPQTSCTPTSQILTTFDDIFDTTNPIYAINLEELSILAPYCENGYASVYFSLYDASGNTVLYVQASSSVDSGDEVTILDTNNNVVYSSTTLNTISICSLFGSPLYLDNIINPTYNIPTVQTCEIQECTEYDCMEYDEETGECIQEGDCIRYECTSWLDNYAVKVQI